MAYNRGSPTSAIAMSFPTTSRLPPQEQERLDADLFAACWGGDAQKAAELLRRGASPRRRSLPPEGDLSTPLIVAAYSGSLECVDLLLPLSDPSASDAMGFAALHWAAAEGHDECVAALIPEGGAAQAGGKDGWTPLMHAASGGWRRCCMLLVPCGAAEALNSLGHSAADLADSRGHRELARDIRTWARALSESGELNASAAPGRPGGRARGL